jgi:hypothetical protein
MKLQKEYVRIARVFAKRFEKDKNVVGIVLGGGISRNRGDENSEIDIYFYLDGKKRKDFPPEGDINVNGVWFEFKYRDISEERKREWRMVDRWEFKTAKVLFERGGVVSKLYKDKVRFRTGERKKLLGEIGFMADWSLQLAEVFESRGNLRHAHMMVSESLNNFIDFYFILNGEFVPYFKWKWYYFQKLRKPSKRVKDVIFDTYRIRNYSSKELWRRIKVIKREIIKKDLKYPPDKPHGQDLKKVKDFVNSLKEGVKYENPWKD